MKRKLAIVLAVSLLIGVTGCQKEEKSDITENVGSADNIVNDTAVDDTEAQEVTEEGTEEPIAQDNLSDENSLETGPVDIRMSYQYDARKNEDGNIILDVAYNRPKVTVLDNADATAKIEQWIAEDENQFYINCEYMEEEAALLFADGTYEDFPPHANEVDYSEGRADDKVISLIRKNYTNTGGAHGYTFVSGVNFDTKTGEILTIADIAEDKDAFMTGVRTYVEELCRSDAYKDRLMPGYEENLEFVLQDDLWYLDREGIVFIANAYELAAYVEGTLYFHIPYNELEGLKTEYSYTGGFQKSAGLGETITIDLDGDGTKEEIIYNAEYSADDYMSISSLTINGEDYSHIFEDGLCYIDSPYERYVVLDIDDSDNLLEIALQDYGMSDDPRTTFLRYENGKLTCLGWINDRATDLYLRNNGDGVLHARERIGVFETALIQVSYKVVDGKLERDMTNLYPVHGYNVGGFDNEKTLLQDFEVYETMSTQGETVTLTKDTVVNVIATDDTEWVQIKDADNQTYYVHLVDGFYVEVNGESVPTEKVFTPIFMAG